MGEASSTQKNREELMNRYERKQSLMIPLPTIFVIKKEHRKNYDGSQDLYSRKKTPMFPF